MNLIFIGLSGCGKSSFGRYCAAITGKPFIDSDEEITKKYGDITEIFKCGGESLFRSIEQTELLRASLLKDGIIATGGGSVLSEDAMTALKAEGLCVYLRCSVDTLAKRLRGEVEKRPLFAGGANVEEVLENMNVSRGELYEKYADLIINEDEVLKSRGIEAEDFTVQAGALYIELVRALEKKVYAGR